MVNVESRRYRIHAKVVVGDIMKFVVGIVFHREDVNS